MTNEHQLFNEMDMHLQNDNKPSTYFKGLKSPLFANTHPFIMLSCLRHVNQSRVHHPEGNVWNHTLMVIDQADNNKHKATVGARVFMWAALLHDIEKSETTVVKNGKITAQGHDIKGAEMTRDFLSCFVEDKLFVSQVAALVRWHMQILLAVKHPHKTNFAAMKKDTDINDIALLGICDRMGRLHADIKKEEQAIKIFLKTAATTP